MVVIFRKDSELGERHANRFIELYNKKKELMESMAGEPHISKVIKSELAIAREKGELFIYLPKEIDSYIHLPN